MGIKTFRCAAAKRRIVDFYFIVCHFRIVFSISNYLLLHLFHSQIPAYFMLHIIGAIIQFIWIAFCRCSRENHRLAVSAWHMFAVVVGFVGGGASIGTIVRKMNVPLSMPYACVWQSVYFCVCVCVSVWAITCTVHPVAVMCERSFAHQTLRMHVHSCKLIFFWSVVFARRMWVSGTSGVSVSGSFRWDFGWKGRQIIVDSVFIRWIVVAVAWWEDIFIVGFAFLILFGRNCFPSGENHQRCSISHVYM